MSADCPSLTIGGKAASPPTLENSSLYISGNAGTDDSAAGRAGNTGDVTIKGNFQGVGKAIITNDGQLTFGVGGGNLEGSATLASFGTITTATNSYGEIDWPVQFYPSAGAPKVQVNDGGTLAIVGPVTSPDVPRATNDDSQRPRDQFNVGKGAALAFVNNRTVGENMFDGDVFSNISGTVAGSVYFIGAQQFLRNVWFNHYVTAYLAGSITNNAQIVMQSGTFNWLDGKIDNSSGVNNGVTDNIDIAPGAKANLAIGSLPPAFTGCRRSIRAKQGKKRQL